MVQQTISNQLLLDEQSCWQAVQTRDARFNGLVYYGVRSTGIYCRPSCPSRRPNREQVKFFQSYEEAEQAGYRPCRRCQPRQALNPDSQVELVTRACRLIESNPAESLTLNELGRQLSVSPYHLHRMFKSVTGITPHQYAAAHRVKEFKSQIKAGSDLITAMVDAGYGSNSRLYENADGQLGMTPASYRRGGSGMQINYTIVDSSLGRLLVAATDRGICAVSFADEDAALEAFLKSEYPAANIQREDVLLKRWVSAILEYLDGSQPHLDLPLDVQATAFQLRVWEELRRIPYGETRTYLQVAHAIGQPEAVRAVGHACATNPAALVTPCHRVVRTDGGMGGYRWGLERKQALLAKEQSQKQPENR
jgi:AraC family transcriptional regulator, regulatory protein of adaptative response / methylated-DNA-[protein]-cysteine methyltransferase